jgi:hypothetical protein
MYVNAPLTVEGALVLASYADLQKQELRNARVQNLAADPGTPVLGQIYYNTGNNTLRFYNGSSFVTLSTGSAMTFGASTATTSYGLSKSDGVGTDAARNDHTHGTPSLSSNVASTQAFGDTATNGSGTAPAKDDHKHAMPAAPTASSVGAVANGGATPTILADVFGSRPAFGTVGRIFIDLTSAIVWRDTGAAWVQLYAFGSPSTQAFGDSAADGTAVTVARSDHKHAMPSLANATAATTYGLSVTNGVATTASRSDHHHGTPALSSNVGSAILPGDTAANGSGTAPSKDDHKHSLPAWGLVAAMAAANTFGGSNDQGAAATFARIDHKHALPAHDASAHSAITINNLAAPTADFSMNSHKITGLTDGTANSDAATYGQLLSAIQGLDWKDAVRVVATTNGAIATAYANGQTVDGQVLATGDRILLAGQTTASENGIYTVNGSGAPTRAVDADATGEISVGTVVPVRSGSADNTNSFYYCTATGANPWVAGTSTSTWSYMFKITSVQAGAGLTASANVFAVGDGVGITVATDSVGVDRTGTNGQHVPLLYTTATHASATSIAITHNLGQRWVAAKTYIESTGVEVISDQTCTDANTTTFIFSTAPTANTIRFVIYG